MERLTAYKMSRIEAEIKLQCSLNDYGIKLIDSYENGYSSGFFCATSDSHSLDGAQVDEKFAQIFGVADCEHHISDDGGVLVVVTKE